MKPLSNHKTFSGGFTLLEILIVVFIIGLSVSGIAIAISESKTDSPAYKEAEDFITAATFVGEYADLNGEVLALFVDKQNKNATQSAQWCYNWKRFRDNQWVAISEDSVTEHCVSADVQWDLIIEGKPYIYDPDVERQPPVIIFASSGETTAVEMAFMDRGASDKPQRIELDLMGNLHWKNKEEEEEKNAR